jgi:hypothetical protein
MTEGYTQQTDGDETRDFRVLLMLLGRTDWQAREAAHHARVDAALAGHRARAGRGQAHPVEDFLFTYYSFRPAALRRWHPGVGVTPADAGPDRDERFVRAGTLDLPAFLAKRGGAVRHVRDLLRATASRPAHLGCFGLHEWAMVYRTPDVRHPVPLRLGAAGTDAVVEGHRIRCSHHDAFRFFTPAATGRNELQPRREDQVALEQPGCLHATMDLYKWAYKLTPLFASELVMDAFELARRTREIDMRAAPYDLADLGYPPIAVETPAGRAEYVAHQRSIAAAGQELRSRMLAVLDTIEPIEPAETVTP